MLIVTGVILLLMAAVFLFAKDIEIRLSESEAQSALDSFLQTESHENFGVRVLPKKVILDFKPDNRALIDSELDLDGHGYAGEFNGRFSASLDYRIPRLYLHEPELVEGGFTTDETIRSELADLKKGAVKALERHRNREDDVSVRIESDEPSDVLVDDFVLWATRSFFENIPIYNLSKLETAGMAASLALKDVRFTEDEAIVTFSAATALLRILSFIGAVLLLLIWFIGPHVLVFKLSQRSSSG